MIDARTDILGLQNITRIWASFHFLPRDLLAEVPGSGINYRNKYRLIAGPNGPLIQETVELARDSSLQAAGIAMHVLADTWAHANFAGTPSLVINNTDSHFYELIPEADGFTRRKITFGHSVGGSDNLKTSHYNNSIYQSTENSIMNLGHGRAGHLPDYSFVRYVYLPAWGGFREIVKDNPHDYLHAFAQMVYALEILRENTRFFLRDKYAWETIDPWIDEIRRIIAVRRTDDSEDWKALGETITGETIEPFDLNKYQSEYINAGKKEKESTFLGRFFKAAIAHKSMVTQQIIISGNHLVGLALNPFLQRLEELFDDQISKN